MSSDQLAPLVADLHLLTVLAATRSFTETARRLGKKEAATYSKSLAMNKDRLTKYLDQVK